MMALTNQKLLKTQDRIVRYSMYDFIAAVEERPQLWDRQNNNYHNREKREKAWLEVAQGLYPKFESVSASDKKKIVMMLTKRWKNTRDSYFRSLRRSRRMRPEQDETRAYIYEREMRFLLRGNDDIIPRDDDNEYITKQEQDEEDFDDDSYNATNNYDDSHDERNGLNQINEEDVDTTMIKVEHEEMVLPDMPAIRPLITITTKQESITTNHLEPKAAAAPSLNRQRKKRRPKSIVVKTKRRRLALQSQTQGAGNAVAKEADQSDATNATVGSIQTEDVNTVNGHAPDDTNNQESETCNKLTKHDDHSKTSPSEFDPDQSFFDSIKPVVRNMSVEQKLDFQISVLKLLKGFNTINTK